MTGQRLRHAIDDAAATLSSAGVDSARADAELLAAHLLGTERGRLALADDPDFFEDFVDRYRRAVGCRAMRTPLQHITGTAAFGPVELEVGPGVFIPRPETESLLEWAAVQRLPAHPVIVDLCTGSGALAVALARHRPDATVIAVDDDPGALSYAQRNVASSAVRLVQADVTRPALLPELNDGVDLVVANPPYLPAGAVLAPEVAGHDPAHALFAGPDGMAVIEPVAGHAARLLKPGGFFAVEHDDTMSAATVRTITVTGAFEDIAAHADLSGRPRFVSARRTERRPAQ